MKLPYEVIDVFTDVPFSGNPAGVVELPPGSDVPDSTLSSIAREIACPNTAFVHTGSNLLRWFTAGGHEVKICGHGTLAAAHYLSVTAAIEFDTPSGPLSVQRTEGGFELEIPVDAAEETAAPDDLELALAAKPDWVGRNSNDYVVLLANESVLADMQPDMVLLATIETRGVIATAVTDSPDLDYVLRFFGPRVGVPEDNVTGTAHSALGPYWAERLGKANLVTRQLSQRPGDVHVGVTNEVVSITGRTVSVMVGQLNVST